MSRVHENWIDGAWRPAASGLVFELASGGARERWPRSGERDLDLALRAAERAQRSWRAIGRGARAWILARAASRLAADPDPAGAVARRLGLERDELAPDHADLEGPGHPGAWFAGPAGASRRDRSGPVVAASPESARAHRLEPGITLPSIFAPHWSELWREPWRELVLRLGQGETIVWIADPALPALAEAAVRALAEAGLPAGVLALVHDDGETCLRAALLARATGALSASGPAARIRRLERLARRLASSAPAPELRLRLLRNRTRVVSLDEDPSDAAAEVAEHAFGRATALSGERPGQIGRVLCHERHFSRFTSALLEDLASQGPSRGARLEESTLVHLRRAGELGLDEGATPILHTAFGVAGSDGRATRDADERDPAPAGRAPLGLVFTNVEERMRLAWLGRPAPLLSLLRIEDEDEARALAARFDHDPRAEDLSAGPEDARDRLENAPPEPAGPRHAHARSDK